MKKCISYNFCLVYHYILNVILINENDICCSDIYKILRNIFDFWNCKYINCSNNCIALMFKMFITALIDKFIKWNKCAYI